MIFCLIHFFYNYAVNGRLEKVSPSFTECGLKLVDNILSEKNSFDTFFTFQTDSK